MLFVLVSGSVDLVLPWKKASSISLLPTALSGYTVVPALSSRLMVNSTGHLVSTGQLQASDAGTYQIRSSDFVGVLSISITINSEHHSIAAVLGSTVVSLGSTVVSPYVGMARKQNGGYNASISVQTLIFHLVVNSTRLKTVRSALWRCPNSTVALRLLENVVKVTNLEVVKIKFRHLPVLLSFFLSSSSSSPASLA